MKHKLALMKHKRITSFFDQIGEGGEGGVCHYPQHSHKSLFISPEGGKHKRPELKYKHAQTNATTFDPIGGSKGGWGNASENVTNFYELNTTVGQFLFYYFFFYNVPSLETV